MTFAQFKSRWIGRRVDFDHVFAYQCVDLIKQYWYEVYGIRSGAWGNAIDYWVRPNRTMLKYFSKVAGSNAKTGDVVVLRGHSGNPYGHIGIATGRLTGSQVEILEQNGSSGSGSGTGGNAIRTRFVDRSRVAGLLRRKVAAPSLPQVVVAQRGWGLSHIAKAAKFKDWWSPLRWQAISNLNNGGSWIKFNRSLKPNQRVRVRK